MAKITITIMILLLASLAWADEDEYGQLAPRQKEFYKAASPDYTIEDIKDVIVERWTPLPYTMRTCDFQIMKFEIIIEDAKEQIKVWQDIRALLEPEAKKVKLKKPGTGS